MAHFYKKQPLIRLAILTLEEVLPHIKTEPVNLRKAKPEYAVVGGFRFKIGTLRLVTFKTRGIKCVCCGVEGTFFAVETQKKGISPHINLYAIDGAGDEVLMTHDHIIPRSKDGADKLENCQTMCKPCNAKKGVEIW